MAQNKVQYQRGLPILEFIELYGSHERCEEAIRSWRWPEGFICPRCQGRPHSEFRRQERLYFQCSACRYQCSVLSGTIFESSKLALPQWFLAMHLMTQAKNNISALELKRHLDVSYPTAWLVKHKLMEVMFRREQDRKLTGRVEADDAYLGGERSGGKRGRGAAGKTPIVAAVETTAARKPRRIRLTVVKGFRKNEVEKIAKRDFMPGSNVVSDGLSCWPAVERAGCRHFPMRTGSGRQAARWAAFAWVNTTLGNIKTALAGTYHHVSAKHAQSYLASFAYRFNRRHQLDSIVERLAWAAVRTAPHTYRAITADA